MVGVVLAFSKRTTVVKQSLTGALPHLGCLRRLPTPEAHNVHVSSQKVLYLDWGVGISIVVQIYTNVTERPGEA